jgi:hypothetical protein
MGRIISLALGLGVTGFLAYKVMYAGGQNADGAPIARPTQQLNNVRDAAKRIETEQARHVEDVLEKTKE